MAVGFVRQALTAHAATSLRPRRPAGTMRTHSLTCSWEGSRMRRVHCFEGNPDLNSSAGVASFKGIVVAASASASAPARRVAALAIDLLVHLPVPAWRLACRMSLKHRLYRTGFLGAKLGHARESEENCPAEAVRRRGRHVESPPREDLYGLRPEYERARHVLVSWHDAVHRCRRSTARSIQAERLRRASTEAWVPHSATSLPGRRSRFTASGRPVAMSFAGSWRTAASFSAAISIPAGRTSMDAGTFPAWKPGGGYPSTGWSSALPRGRSTRRWH
jgi:hypothetical protein